MKNQITCTLAGKAEMPDDRPERFRYQVSFATPLLITYKEACIYSQIFSGYIIFLQLYQLEVKKHHSIHFQTEEKNIFFLFNLQGYLSICFPDGGIFLELAAGMCAAVFSPPSKYRLSLNTGNYSILCFVLRQEWLKKNIEDFGPIREIIEYAETGQEERRLLAIEPIQIPVSRVLLRLQHLKKMKRNELESSLLSLAGKAILGYETAIKDGQERRFQTTEEKVRTIHGLIPHLIERGEPISIIQLSESYHLTPITLRRTHKRLFGISIRDFLLSERMKTAVRLLTETDLSVARISERLNYSSPYLFSVQFTRHHGYPPIKLKKEKRRQSNDIK